MTYERDDEILKLHFHKYYNDFCDSLWQCCQLFLIVLIPIYFTNSSVADIINVNDKINVNGVEILIYYAVRQGDFVVSLFFVLMLIRLYYKINENKLLNVGMRYHDHSMIYYHLCAKLLGYNKCSLVRVPIGMQFRLVLNDCFEEYDDGGDDVYAIGDKEDIKEKEIESTNCSRIINICIEDTYPINVAYIPSDLRRNKTIIISRYMESRKGIRSYSQALVDKVALIINNLSDDKYTVNIMATTNVRNTIRIARDVFKVGCRGKVEHLNVYQQPNGSENRWEFSCPMKVF